ncbi:rRNA biogenesis protein rrp36 [Cladochytrium tenue]|nr:rRNA biogenesis protein rrp36 [Cladochytrium tenue]
MKGDRRSRSSTATSYSRNSSRLVSDDAHSREARRVMAGDFVEEPSDSGSGSDNEYQLAARKGYHNDDDDDDSEVVNEDEEDPESADDGNDSNNGSADQSDSESDHESKQLVKSLQRKLSNVPLGELLKVQQRMGSKAFQKLRDGASLGGEDDDEVDDDGDVPSGRAGGGTAKEKKPTKMKRKDRHAPMEVSSKRPVGRHRQVVEVASKKSRDPRFERLSGKFNEGVFENSYRFLKEYEEKEINDLRNRVNSATSEDSKEELKSQLTAKVS